MATLDLTGATVTVGGVALSSYATDVKLPIDPEPGDSGWATERLAALNSGSLSVDFAGHWDGPPLFPDLPVERTITVTVPWHIARRWLAQLELRRRTRIRRMHAAYRRRHGRGGW